MPDLNDRALQLATVDRPTIALDFGTGFTDAWLNSIGMAYLFYPAASTWLASGLPGVKQHS